jgi:hypothetical protein
MTSPDEHSISASAAMVLSQLHGDNFAVAFQKD